MNVPVIDVSPFLDLTQNDKAPIIENEDFRDGRKHLLTRQTEVANQIRYACESHGFFYITGLDDEYITIMSKAISQIRSFFDNENEEFMKHYKDKCASKNSKLFRGYTQTGGGNNCVATSKIPELKESFTIGAEGEGKSPMHGPNLWPSVKGFSEKGEEKEFCQSFRHDMTQYFDQLLKISRHVAHALALSLNLDGNFFTERMAEPVAQLVAFKYPPEVKYNCSGDGCHEEETKQISCGEHTDCGFLTLLVQTAPGLEVYSKVTKSWHIVEPVDKAILVNLGDLTQFWTKGKYKSTPHRVHNRSCDDTDRYSLVFFANCDFNAQLDELSSTSNSSNSIGRAEDDVVITAGEYILEKLGLMWLMNDGT